MVRRKLRSAHFRQHLLVGSELIKSNHFHVQDSGIGPSLSIACMLRAWAPVLLTPCGWSLAGASSELGIPREMWCSWMHEIPLREVRRWELLCDDQTPGSGMPKSWKCFKMR